VPLSTVSHRDWTRPISFQIGSLMLNMAAVAG
jgi:hypothetical protein